MQKSLGLLAVLIMFTVPARAQDSTTQEAQKEPEAKRQAPTEEEKEKPQQATPKYELAGTYTYRSYKPPSSPSFGMNGWGASFAYTWKNWLSFVADGTGTYKDQGLSGKTSIYTGLGGARFIPFGHRHRFMPFGQILAGLGYERLNIPAQAGFPSATRSSTAWVWQGGGGLDVRITRHWVVRAFEYDYEKSHYADFLNLVSSPSESGHRISIGIVYRWGEK